MSQIDISRLIDLALVTPETGNLNLKILHKVLHAIASQLNFKTTKSGLKENVEPTREIDDKENEENSEQIKPIELDGKEFSKKENEEKFKITESKTKENMEIFELDDKKNPTKENEENFVPTEKQTKENYENSNLDEKENSTKIPSKKTNEIENFENENLEAFEENEENLKETKSHKDFHCLSKKVDQLRKNLCHLEKLLHG